MIERAKSLDRRSLFLITLLLATLSILPYQFWKQPSESDRANWDYIAQVISRGGVPYRDVVNIKTPLSAYIGAAAIVIARPFGLRDIFAIRIVFLVLAATTAGFTFLIADEYFRDRKLGLLAAAIMMSFVVFAETNSGGVQPKTPMVLFGLMSLLAISRRHPFWAGALGMLSALSWQPGLLFVGVAALSFSQYLTVYRDWKGFRVIAGAALPLAIMLGYFWARGALADFYLWNIHFNYSVYGPEQSRSVGGFIDRLWRMLAGAYRGEFLYFLLAAAGLGVTLSRVFKNGLRQLAGDAPAHSIIIAPAVYFAFCMIDIQGAADLIPLLPFVAMFAALLAVSSLAWVSRLLGHKLIERWGAAGILVAILALVMMNAISYRVGFPALSDQDADIAEMKANLRPGDKVFAQGAAEILVLSGLTNASRHYFLDRGKDRYLDQVEPGGFAGWFERLRVERPKIVALERMKFVAHREEFYEWVRTGYEEYKGRAFTYHLRKD